MCPLFVSVLILKMAFVNVLTYNFLTRKRVYKIFVSSTSMSNLSKKSKGVLITGSAGGLGLAISKKFYQQGYDIYGLDVKPFDKTLDWQNYFQVDLTDFLKVADVVQKIGSKIDVLINNAGIWLEGKLEENTVQEIERLILVNLTSQIVLTNQILPFLKQKSGAKIANISSIRGMQGADNRTVYSASKFGIRGFTDSLRLELEPFGIKVFGFYPAGIKTDLFKKVEKERDLSDHLDPDDLAGLIFETLQNSDSKYYLPEIVIQKPFIVDTL
jgi:NAD(P)-dependent dehydrogenase (short-subunit alcohol dehydrogenase family)